MGLNNKLEAAGRTNVALDGGLNTRIDPNTLTPPETTTADNVWHATNGTIRQLPTPSNNQVNTGSVYTITNTNGVEPFGAGGALVIQDNAVTAGLVGPNFTGSQTQGHLSPLNLKTRVLGTPAVAYTATDGKNQQFATPPGLAADATYRPYVLAVYQAGGNYAVTAGDLVTQTQTSTIIAPVPAAGSVIGCFPGRTDYFFTATPNNTTVDINLFAFNSPGVVAFSGSVSTAAVNALNVFYVGPQAYVAITDRSGAVGYATVSVNTSPAGTFVQLINSGVGYNYHSVSAAVASSGVGQGIVALAALSNNTTPPQLTTIVQPVGSLGSSSNVTTSVQALPAATSVASPFIFGRVTTAVTPTIWQSGAQYRCVSFVEYAKTYSTSPGTAYGLPASAVLPQIAIFPYNVTQTGGSAATLAYAGLGGFETQEGCALVAGAFATNGFDASYSPYGSQSSQQILCPIVIRQNDTTANGTAFGQGQYIAIDASGTIVSKWNEAQGVGFYPYGSTLSQFPQVLPTTPVLSPNDNALVDWIIPYVTPGERRFQAAPIKFTPTNAAEVVYQTSGQFTFSAYYSALATFSFQRQGAACPPVSYGRNLVFGGAATQLYDGQVLHEANFWMPPRTLTVGTLTGTTASISGNQAYSYLYTVIYRWVDAQGLVHRSRQGPPTQVILGAPLSGTFSINLGIPNVLQSAKFAGGSPVTATVYRTLANGSSLFAVGSVTLAQPQVGTGNLGQFWTAFQDTVSDAALFPIGTAVGGQTAADAATQLDIAFFTLPADIYTGATMLQYPPEAPPSFLWQVTSAGRQFGLACVNGAYRIYFSQVWDEQHPPEWNTHCYQPCPPELGEVRSIAAMDSYIVAFGVRGIGAFSGAGPSRTGYPDFSYNYINNANFTAVTPLPVSAGVRGTGAPVLVPNGIMYQDRQGMTLLDRSLNPTFSGIGDKVQELTGIGVNPGTIYGRGTLLESLQAVAWANPVGPALVYDFAQNKWSTWSGAQGSIGFVESQDRRMWAALCAYTGSFMPLGNNGLFPIDQFNLGAAGYGMQVETPWLEMQPQGQNATNTGEGDLLEMQLLGDFYGQHTLQVEIAVNYGGYTTNADVPGSVVQISVLSQPNPAYQFRFHPPGTTRAWAVRYRITVIQQAGGIPNESARISGITLLTSARSGTTRLGNTVSR